MATTFALPREVSALVDQIAHLFQPQRIILFGSHVTGATHRDSDVDLLVVMETDLRPLRQAGVISSAVDHHVPMDILVRTPDQLRERNPKDLILREILREGITVYEAGD